MMWGLIAAALAAAWAFAGMRNAPSIVHAHAASFGAFVAVSVLVAYWCGRRRARASAEARATARAEARARAQATATSSAVGNAVNVAVFAPSPRAETAVERYQAQLDAAPWLGRPRPYLDELEAFEVAYEDVAEQHTETA